MIKQPVRVMIGRAVQLSAPGMLGRKFDFEAGHTFLTQEWHYPGETVDLAGGLYDQWSFGTNTGTDLPLTFRAEDVKEVVIPNDPETVKVFEGAPFHVVQTLTADLKMALRPNQTDADSPLAAK